MNIETDLKAVSQNLNTYSDGFKVLRTIASLFRTYKPMAFFGVIALILAVLGVGFMIPVLVEFNHTGLVERFPTFDRMLLCYFSGDGFLFWDCNSRRSRERTARILRWNYSMSIMSMNIWKSRLDERFMCLYNR